MDPFSVYHFTSISDISDVDTSFDELDGLQEFQFGAIRVDQDGSLDATSYACSVLVSVSNDTSSTLEPKARKHRLSSPLPIQDQRPAKRQRLDNGSLFRSIYLPHYIAPPEPRPATRTFPPLKRKPSPLEPHTKETVDAWLSNPHARGVWVVPVRTETPWDSATSAVMSAEDAANPKGERSQLVWTPESLLGFWEHLKAMQKKFPAWQMGISYHAALTPPRTQSLLDQTGAQPGWSEEDGVSKIEAPRSTKLEGDFIKVHHELEFTMNVRHVIHVFRHSILGSTVPIFKYAYLVLLDERSKPVLIA